MAVDSPFRVRTADQANRVFALIPVMSSALLGRSLGMMTGDSEHAVGSESALGGSVRGVPAVSAPDSVPCNAEATTTPDRPPPTATVASSAPVPDSALGGSASIHPAMTTDVLTSSPLAASAARSQKQAPLSPHCDDSPLGGHGMPVTEHTAHADAVLERGGRFPESLHRQQAEHRELQSPLSQPVQPLAAASPPQSRNITIPSGGRCPGYPPSAVRSWSISPCHQIRGW